MYYNVKMCASDEDEDQQTDIHWESQDVVGQWCVLTYDHDIYPGTILEVNETHVRVKCMHQI